MKDIKHNVPSAFSSASLTSSLNTHSLPLFFSVIIKDLPPYLLLLRENLKE
jgi:hypothetical protein